MKEAEAALRRVIELRPGDVAAYANLAMLMLKCARIDAAVDGLPPGAWRSIPKAGELHLGLGRALHRGGKLSRGGRGLPPCAGVRSGA